MLGIDFVTARDDVLAVLGEEADHLVVPCGFLVFFQNLSVFAFAIVVNQQGNKAVFYGIDDEWIGHDLMTKLFAAGSSGDFLEEGKDGFAGFLGLGQSGVVVAEEFGGSGFLGVGGIGLIA